MIRAFALFAVLPAVVALCGVASAQETAVAPPAVEDEAASVDSASKPQVVDEALDKLDEVAAQVDQNEQAQEVKKNVLGPIYALAETFSFPAFYWLAFAAMVTGVVSFALQLALGKLVALSKFSLSPTEILSDALGLAISLIGLVLTTQAATENSTFTTSAFAVLSATVVGVLLGIVFYVWGQRQELQAVEGRRTLAAKTTVVDDRART
jgi:hypothetical protein